MPAARVWPIYRYVNLYTRIKAARPSTCNVVLNAFEHLIISNPMDGSDMVIYGLMIGMGPKFLSVPSPPDQWPEGQGHGLGSL